MGHYTLELREVVEQCNLHEIIKFDIFNEDYRKILMDNIINYYYFREIGSETIGRFIHYFNNKMALIMPYYNKFYETDLLDQRILDNYDVTETYKKTTNEIVATNVAGDQKIKSSNNVTNLDLKSDTPGNRINIDSNDYVSEINKTNGTNAATNDVVSSSDSTTNNDGVENWIRTMSGNIGVQNDSQAIDVYRKCLLKIDMMIIEELSDLFMGVY